MALWRLGDSKAKPPVLVLTDLGAPVRSVASLVAALRARGREVFVAEWPRDAAPEELFLRHGPRALGESLRGRDRVALVGHGVGGALALLLAAAAPDRVAAVVTLGAPVRWSVPNLAVERALDNGAPAPGTPGTRAEAMLYDGVPGPARWGPYPLERVAAWMREGDLRFHGASYARALAGVRAPVRAWCGTADDLVPREACLVLRDFVAHADARPAGRIEWMKRDYSHAGLVAGADAAREIFPAVAEFLEENAE
jgi:pimeloyl-ACP methyl ester carboxylesterase